LDDYKHVLILLLAPGLIGILGLTSIEFLIDTHGYVHSDRVEEITVYTPPTLSKLINDYSELFMTKHGVRVNVVVDATGRLINKLELTKKGDVLITADHYFMEYALERGLVYPSLKRITLIIPALMVSKKSNVELKQVGDLAYLASKGLKIGIADPEVAPFGRIGVEYLRRAGVYELIRDKLYIYPDVGVLARYLQVGVVDVAILPHIIKYWYPGDVEIVWPKPEEISGLASCQVGAVTKYSTRRDLADLFLNELVEYVEGLDPVKTGYVGKLSDLSRIAPYDYGKIDLPWVCLS